MNIIQTAKDNNLPTVLIFEDDNKPTDNFDLNWKNLKVWLDNNLDKWEIINGGFRFSDWEDLRNTDTTKSIYEDEAEIKYRLKGNINLFKSEHVVSNNWMYINSSAYDKILKWSYSDHHPIDVYMNNNKYFNSFIVLPVLGFQINSYSNTIKNNQQFDISDKKK